MIHCDSVAICVVLLSLILNRSCLEERSSFTNSSVTVMDDFPTRSVPGSYIEAPMLAKGILLCSFASWKLLTLWLNSVEIPLFVFTYLPGDQHL